MKKILIGAAVLLCGMVSTASAQVDHYLCWQYKGDSKMGLTTVTDQFVVNAPVDGKKLKFMCNPALKNDSNLLNLNNPNDHLFCYTIKPVKVTVPSVLQSDQFINEPLLPKNKAKMFCVPGEKL